MVHMPNCRTLKWQCMIHLGIFDLEDIKLKTKTIRVDFQGNIPL
jgi:hypothetical protein